MTNIKTTVKYFFENHHYADAIALDLKGGESSSQFQWFALAKIELYFLIFFVLILGLRLQRYSKNTKRCSPENSFWKL